MMLIFIIAITVGACLYALKWHKVYLENKLNTPIITTYIQEVKDSELINYTNENPRSVIYFCIPSNSDCRIFEGKFKNYILNNNLKETIVYLNVDELDKNNFEVAFDNKYNNDELRSKNRILNEVPTVAIYNHTKMIGFVSSKGLSIDTVNQFLVENNIIGD